MKQFLTLANISQSYVRISNGTFLWLKGTTAQSPPRELLTSTWPHLRRDVGLENGEYWA